MGRVEALRTDVKVSKEEEEEDVHERESESESERETISSLPDSCRFSLSLFWFCNSDLFFFSSKFKNLIFGSDNFQY